MSDAKPIRQPRAKRTRIQLLEAARRAFAERGYAGTTIDEIAEAAGVSKGAYYFHFKSKEDVLVALIDDWAMAVSKRLEPLAGEKLELRTMLDALLSTGGAVWSPALLIEFWSQAERTEPVKEALTRAQRSWRAAAAKRIGKAHRARLIAAGLTTDSTLSMLQAIRDGLVVRASQPGGGSASHR